MNEIYHLKRVLKANDIKSQISQRQIQIHISVSREFFEVFLVAQKQLLYKTQAEFFREKMREAIAEAERRTKGSQK